MLSLRIAFSAYFLSKIKGYSDVELLATPGTEYGFFLIL